MNGSTASHRFLLTWALWTAGFLAFPFAGLAGTAVAGRVDDASTRSGGYPPPPSGSEPGSCSAPGQSTTRTRSPT